MVINNSHLWLKNTEIFGKAFGRERKTLIWCRKEGFSKIFVWSLKGAWASWLVKGVGWETWENKSEALYLFTDLYLFCLCLICTVFVLYCICFVFLHLYCICFVRVQACEDAPCWCIKRRKSRKREILKNILRGFVYFWKQQEWSALDLTFFLVFFLYKFPNEGPGV